MVSWRIGPRRASVAAPRRSCTWMRARSACVFVRVRELACIHVHARAWRKQRDALCLWEGEGGRRLGTSSGSGPRSCGCASTCAFTCMSVCVRCACVRERAWIRVADTCACTCVRAIVSACRRAAGPSRGHRMLLNWQASQRGTGVRWRADHVLQVVVEVLEVCVPGSPPMRMRTVPRRVSVASAAQAVPLRPCANRPPRPVREPRCGAWRARASIRARACVCRCACAIHGACAKVPRSLRCLQRASRCGDAVGVGRSLAAHRRHTPLGAVCSGSTRARMGGPPGVKFGLGPCAMRPTGVDDRPALAKLADTCKCASRSATAAR